MLVSHKFKFIYLKTIKTAGTSIETYFEPYCRPHNEFITSHFSDEYIGESGIVGYRGYNSEGSMYYNHMPGLKLKSLLGDDVWNSYFKFCAVRNPWQKAISAFAFKQYLDDESIVEPTLADRVRQPFRSREQLRFLRWLQQGGQPIDQAIYAPEGLLLVDGIIRHECLQIDMEKICRRLNLPWAPQKLHSHKMGIRPRQMTAKKLIRAPADMLIRNSYLFEINTFKYTDPNSAGEIPQALQL